MENNICPVPIDQIPIQEYEKLSKSIFFNWPVLGKIYLFKKLVLSWFISLPIILTISTGSNELVKNPLRLVLVSVAWSLFIPIILITRHLLSWDYVYKRLRSENIEYEESGWYDGQTWEKTIEMREKDLLTAQHDIKPIIQLLKKSIIIASSLFILVFGMSEILSITFR